MKKLFLIFVLAASFCGYAQHSSSQVKIKNSSSHTSISKSESDTEYSYLARFDREKTDEVKEVIVRTLGTSPEATERTALWDGKGYSVSIRTGKVEITMEKNRVTKSFQLKIEDLGEQVSEVLDQPKAPRPPRN